jgi:hypothetical protein
MPRGPSKTKKSDDPQKVLMSELVDLLESGKTDKYLNDDLRIKVYDGKYDEVRDAIAKIKAGTKVQPQMVAAPSVDYSTSPKKKKTTSSILMEAPKPAKAPSLPSLKATKAPKSAKAPKAKKTQALPGLDDLLKEIKATSPGASIPQSDDMEALFKQAETKLSKPKKEPKKEPKMKTKSSSKVFSEIKKHASSIVKLVDETI